MCARSHPLPAFEPDIDDGGLCRLIREILHEASGRPPEDDVVAHLEKVLRTTDGVLDTAALFEGVPGRKPNADIRKRVSADLLRHGVLERNPDGRGFIVVDLEPD
jgi:hypothetical protein